MLWDLTLLSCHLSSLSSSHEAFLYILLPHLCSLSPFAKNILLAFFPLSSCLLLLLSLSLSDYSVALSKSNYMCLITSRAIKPLVRGARRSSLMMTIKKGERERQRQREKERGQEGGETGYRWEMKEAFRCPFYYLLSVAPVVKNPSGELVVAVLSQIYGSEGKKGKGETDWGWTFSFISL